MRYEEAHEGWNAGRLLGVGERSFRRYLVRYEGEGLDGRLDQRLEQVSNRKAPVDEVLKLTASYRPLGWCTTVDIVNTCSET
jgi:hypothetical protein